MKKIDWRTYNKSLISRGEINFWFDPEIFDHWFWKKAGRRLGAPRTYSDLAIRTLNIIRFRFGLSLRETQGFARSLAAIMGERIAIPDYSTISRRLRKLNDTFRADAIEDRPVTVAVDGSGFKVFGEGEWKVRIHGVSKRRLWRKIHIAVNTEDNQILSVVFSNSSLGDVEAFTDLVNQINAPIEKVVGDGAYEARECYEWAEEHNVQAVFSLPKNATINKPRNGARPLTQRNENIWKLNKLGRKKWKKALGYSQRSLVETAFFRLKTLLSPSLCSRNYENQAIEAFLKCWIINQMPTPKKLALIT